MIIFNFHPLYFIFLLALMLLSCDKTDQYVFIEGCNNIAACNYDTNAEVDDGSCEFNDCFGICGGSAVFDECDVCDGNNLSCEDCDGMANGEAYLDCCGNCDINSTNNCTIDEYDICHYDVEISICELEYIGSDEVIFTICANSPNYDISGFQFSLNAPTFNIIEVSLGADAILSDMNNYDTSGLSVLAFTLSSNFINSGSNLELALFRGTYALAEGFIQIISTYGDNGSLSIAGSNAEELSILVNINDWSEIPIN